MSTHQIDTGTKIGTLGGTLLTVLFNLSSGELGKTMVLACVGAVTSFLTSLLMKRLIRWVKERYFS